MLPTQSIEQIAGQIDRAVQLIKANKPIDEEHEERLLDLFEDYECWDPFFLLLKKRMQQDSARKLDDYVRCAKIQNLHLENLFSAAETCVQAVQQLKLSYPVFSQEVLNQMIDPGDWAAETAILNAVSPKFEKAEDRVRSLERICLLYEKKMFNESKLSESYGSLLRLDPKNLKALRYFKLVYSQSYEWDKVVDVLQRLIAASTHPQDVFRVAQELAAVYLYQLDHPEKAIETIQKHCEQSPLDTTTIMFDAYQRIGNWQGCLEILRSSLLTASDDEQRSVIHFKIGQLEEKTENYKSALHSYERAAKMWPKLLEAFERAISVGIVLMNWRSVLVNLDLFSEQVQDSQLREQLLNAKKRLNEGIGHGAISHTN